MEPPAALTTNDSISREKNPKTLDNNLELDAPDLLGLGAEGPMREWNNSDKSGSVTLLTRDTERSADPHISNELNGTAAHCNPNPVSTAEYFTPPQVGI